MVKSYTTNTASLKATTIDARNIDAKKIKIKGQDVQEMIQESSLTLPRDYPKFVNRCELPNDKNWALMEDDGTIVYMNFADKIVNGEQLFKSCYNGKSFTVDLPNLTNGTSMFYYSPNLETFTSDLSSLTNGTSMFGSCSNLETFISDLSSLTNGNGMFNYCKKLTSLANDSSGTPVNLSSLTDGSNMFGHCKNFTSFGYDLSSLVKGYYMFNECNNLTTFTSDLSSLTNGFYMFNKCKLDTTSFKHIADTIKDVKGLTNGNYSSDVYKTIHIELANTTLNDQENGCVATIKAKGWVVVVNGKTM